MTDSGKKNIVIFIGQLAIGGAEKQSLLLAKVLSDHYRVCYVVFKPFKVADSYLHYLQESKLNYEILAGNFPTRIFHLIRLLRSFRTDLLFCYLPGDNIAGAICGRLAGVPNIIGGIRGSKIVRKKFYLLRFVQNHFQDYVIFNSTRTREIFCSRAYRRDRSLVIENAFEEKLDFIERPEQEPLKILMVGRFVWPKDYLTGIRAVAGLSELVAKKKIRLVVAGYGSMEHQVRNWISEYGLDEITDFHIQSEKIPELYRSSDIYLISSVNEGFSNSVLEAMAHGLPVVGTLTGDIEKQVLHGRSGYLAAVKDHKELTRGLSLLCERHSSRLSFGKEGYKRLYACFGLEPFKEKYIKFIQSLE